jgi:CRISPR-associated protein Cmr4
LASKTFDDLGVLGLYVETPLHCGAEGGTGYVDLPIQRERHTHYPVVPGSTIKGVLRDELQADLQEEGLRAVFGADGTKDEKATAPGTFSFGDGILVAFPVRSSGAPFHWVTCPFVLERVFRALGKKVDVLKPEHGHARAREAGEVLLEEIRLTKEADPGFFADPTDNPASGLGLLLGLLPDAERGFAYTRSIFGDRLLIVSDDDFKELVETGTEVITRIKLNALGTTAALEAEKHAELSDYDRQGNMFVEEVVPPEALFLASLRGGNGTWQPKLVEALKGRPVIRLGGDETIGRGVTHLTFVGRAS